MFFLKYIRQEMRLQPGWYAGLFLTDGTLLYLFGLLLERILRNNDSFEILLHFVLLMPVLLLLTFAVLLPLYAQKQRNDLLYPEYRDLLSMELSRRQILSIRCIQTFWISAAAFLVFAPLSSLTMQYLRRLEGDPLWQTGWRNRSVLPVWMLVYCILLTASLFCCLYVSRRKKPEQRPDPRSKYAAAKQILRKPDCKTYARLRRNRIRHEGRIICAALALLCTLPVLFSILLTDTLFPADPYTPDNVLYLSMTDSHPAAISMFLLTQIEQVEGVALEKAYSPSETVPPSYRSATFRLDPETWQESAAAVRKIVARDRSADFLHISVPLEDTLQDTQHADTADLLFILLLLISACVLCFSGTAMILQQYLYSRQEELWILSAFGLRRRNCFRMLSQTILGWLTCTGLFSLLTGSGIWLLYDGITYTQNTLGDPIAGTYQIASSGLRLLLSGGSGFFLLLLVLGILSLLRFLDRVYPDTRTKPAIHP